MDDVLKVIDGLKRMRIGLFNAKIDKEPIRPYLDAAISALEAQKADTWIPIMESIPENSRYYDVTMITKAGCAFTEYLYYDANKNIWLFIADGKDEEHARWEEEATDKVIAWKHRPEPWKEEQ